MKISLAICFIGLLCAAPGRAQDDTTPETPRYLQFNFGYSSSDKEKVTEIEIGYKRLYSDTEQPVFDKTLIGKGGLLNSETISFLDGKGQVIGTLSSAFNVQGQLGSQKLSAKGRAVRVLSWFKTRAQSPELSLAGSVLRVSYGLKNGAFNSRTLRLKVPDGERKIVSSYDARGRRTRDFSSDAKSPIDLHFFYDALGLTRFSMAATDSAASKEALLRRARSGLLNELLFKEGGILTMRAILRSDDRGKSRGARTEIYENGKLSRVVEIESVGPSDKNGTTTQEEYDAGVLSERKVIKVDADGKPQMRRYEKWSEGKLQQRADFDEKGTLLKVTTFKADGTIERVEDFPPGDAPKTLAP